MTVEPTVADVSVTGTAGRGREGASANHSSHPGLIRLTGSRTAIELKQFFRQPESAVFTFALPLLLLLLFGSIFSGAIEGPPGAKAITFRQYFLAGMVASGVMSACFNNLAISISIEKSEGMLKLLGLTPLPPAAYFGGKLLSCLVISIIEAVLMLIVGLAMFGLSLPVDVTHWVVFGGVFVIGVVTCVLLGIAYTRLIPNSRAAAPMVMPIYLILQFISGVFFQFTQIPTALRWVADVFPLRWMALGLRYAFLPDWFKSQETGQQWNLPVVFTVLAAWLVVGSVLAARTFKWGRIPND
ncbi:MAG: ABC transporter permease [Ilumatobacteraceae bacterium]